MPSHLDAVGDQIADDVAHIDAALHRVLTKIRVFDQGTGWASQGFRSCAGWLSWRVGWTENTAREHVRVANALGALPLIDRALERGELSYCKVRAMTRVATADNEHVLLEQALLLTGAQLEALCRKYASVRDHDDPEQNNPRDDLDRRCVTRHDREDGMVVIKAVLHPDEAAKVWVVLERVAAERCRARDASTLSDLTSARSQAEPASAEAPRVEPPRADAPAETPRVEPSRADASAETPRVEPPRADVSAEAPRVGPPPVDASAEAPRVGPPRADASADARSAREARRRMPFDRASALVELAEETLRGKAPMRSPTELVVSVPIEMLQHPDSALSDPTRIAATADGTALSLQAIRRIACDCGVVPLVENADGTPLSTGRKHRVIKGALKRATLHRDTTCRFPGCRARAFLEGHHVVHWLDGGETTMSNVIELCSFHHRFVHEYGFTIEFDPTTNTVTACDTANHRSISTLPLSKPCTDLGWPNIHARNERFAIDADTQPCWDNTPVDYPELVDRLLRTDDRARLIAEA